MLIICWNQEILTSVFCNLRKICHEVGNATRDCGEIFKIITHCNSDFVSHAMITSNPFTVCTDNLTFPSYRFSMEFYEKLFTTPDPHNPSAVCADNFMSKNRMNLIVSLINNSKDVWESANCDACYDNSTSPVQNLTRNAKEFFNLSGSFDECVKNATKNSNNRSEVCTECDKNYQKLNNLFEQLKTSSNNKICFDLEDKVKVKFRLLRNFLHSMRRFQMNKTRRSWSDYFKCVTDKENSLAAFYSLSAVVYSIAIGFYFAVYYVGTKYPTTEIVDDREVSTNNDNAAVSSTEPGTSSSSSSQRESPKIQSLNPVQEESDDEMLVGGAQSNAQSQELIGLDF